MFWFRDQREGDVRVDVAFTDSTVDLQGLGPDFPAALALVEEACGLSFARAHQVHGDAVEVVTAPGPEATSDDLPEVDALVTTTPGVGLMTRVADCVPVVLADADAGVVGAVHSGRPGTVLDVVGRAVERMREHGAGHLVAWIGPHVCGRCYEVPEQMREEVAAVVPEAWSETSWGTPALDLGAAVRAQLLRHGAEVVEVGGCTREEPRLHSYRRDGDAAGRFAGLVWIS